MTTQGDAPPPAGLDLSSANGAGCITFGGVVTVDLSTGKVTIAEGVTLDEASRLFWDGVEAAFGRRA